MPAAPAGGQGYATGHASNARDNQNLPGVSSEELEQQIEAMFDKADDFMINQEKFVEAVSN